MLQCRSNQPTNQPTDRPIDRPTRSDHTPKPNQTKPNQTKPNQPTNQPTDRPDQTTTYHTPKIEPEPKPNQPTNQPIDRPTKTRPHHTTQTKTNQPTCGTNEISCFANERVATGPPILHSTYECLT